MRTQSNSAINREIDRDEELVAKGARASGALKSIKPFLDELQAEIASNLSRGAESMTNEAMRILVGELAGLRRLQGRLESASQAGVIAGERRDGH